MIDAFIKRWELSGAAERANCQLFLTELCAVLRVEPPQLAGADEALNAYVFEKSVRFPNRDGSVSLGRIDLYKRGTVRYLRPAYQQLHVVPASTGSAAVQSDLGLPSSDLRPPSAESEPRRSSASSTPSRPWGMWVKPV